MKRAHCFSSRSRVQFATYFRLFTLSLCLILIVCCLPVVSLETSFAKRRIPVTKLQSQQDLGSERRTTPVPPRLGPPAANLPNLDQLRSSSTDGLLRAPVAIPSTGRSRRKQARPVGRSIVSIPTTYAKRGTHAHHARSKDAFWNTPASIPTLPQTQRANVAAGANGGTATAQNFTQDSAYPGLHFQPSYAIDGVRHISSPNGDQYWRDEHGMPTWLQVEFNGLKSIDEIDVYTVGDSPSYFSDPTATTTFTSSGATSFQVQYWNGSAWVTVPGGSVSANNLVWRTISFSAVTTSKVRLTVNTAVDSVARIAEFEAWGVTAPPPMNVASVLNGAIASAQNFTQDGAYPGLHFQPAYAIDGVRHIGSPSGDQYWRDEHGLPTWLQVDFNATRSIQEIDVFTVGNYPDYFSDPTANASFSSNGVTAFDVQYWSGSTWVTVSGGSVSGNSFVWRKFNFTPVTTSRIRVVVNAGFDSVARITELEAWTAQTGSVSASDFAMARLDPKNRTGTGGADLLSNNFNWNLPLVSLPGRNLDLGLTLSYNSLVWTRTGNYVDFDLDQASIAPGFQLSFPTIEGPYVNGQANTNFYLLVMPSGGHVELRKTGTVTYESQDSSLLQLTDNLDGTMTLRPTDGSQLRYIAVGGGVRCNKITDRNGNYISVTYKSWGEIDQITDTLGRVLTFLYDANWNIQKITQTWGTQTHVWAAFGWGTATIGDNFGSLSNFGPDNTTIPVLTQVELPDNSRYTFQYPTNGYGVVSTITYYAADHERNHTTLVYATNIYSSDGLDVPRVTQEKVAAEYWTGLNGVPTEVVTQYAHDTDGACRMTAPDGTIYKEYYGASWQSGLTTLSEVWSGGVRQKWTTTQWTQDNISVGYLTNPRLTESNIYDTRGNRRRTTIDYGSYAQWDLPFIVKEYAANGTTEIRYTQTDYNLSQAYLDRRIIGLVSSTQLYDSVVGQWQAKATYTYDTGAIDSQATNATQHDQNYNSSFTTRGNVTGVSRWDATDINNSSKALTTTATYNAAGSVLSSTDPANHTNTTIYTDSFSDNQNHNTFAYPTTLTDADGFSSSVQYKVEFGAKTRVQTPLPNVTTNQPGPVQTFEYDDALRLTRVTALANSAYTRYEYEPTSVKSWSTVNTVADEAFSVTVFDGMGRGFTTTSNHPGSVGGYKLVNIIFNQMGRPFLQSNPTEVNSSWLPAGDDASGVRYSLIDFDWKGRTIQTTHPDGTYTAASYAGCGCAGGEVVTLTDEMNRQQKVYSDVLGRAGKIEVWTWPDGSGNRSVYSTTVNTFNARDQLTLSRQWAGAENGAGAYQDTTMGYDGFGRFQSKHIPEQQDSNGNSTYTTWEYNSDDTLHKVTDARGASGTYDYNNRHLVTGITYSVPQGSMIPTAPAVTYGYDAVGNRIAMNDGLGSQNYVYDSISRMTSETRYFSSALNQSFTVSYDYNLAGDLKKITDHTNTSINYGFDTVGRLNAVTGSDNLVGGVSNYSSGFQYRAWGGLKQVSIGGTHTSSVSYDSRMQSTNFNISSGVANQNYDHYNDGRISFVHSTTDTNFDRSFTFDHAGRLLVAAAGGAARNDTGPVPMYETFSYNPWSDTTSRETATWTNGFSDAGSYANHRRADWGYDADGRIATIDTRAYTYDAAGRTRLLTGQRWTPGDYYVSTSTANDFDGNGVKIRETYDASVTTYYLRSSVLRGEIIEELNASGQKQVGYVYTPSGSLVARQLPQQNYVALKQMSPIGATQYEFFKGSGITESVLRQELDPMGANVRLNAGPVGHNGGAGDINSGGGASDSRFGAIENPAAGCYSLLDGVPTPCDWINRMARGGALQLRVGNTKQDLQLFGESTMRVDAHEDYFMPGRGFIGYDEDGQELYDAGTSGTRDAGYFITMPGAGPMLGSVRNMGFPQDPYRVERAAAQKAIDILRDNKGCREFIRDVINAARPSEAGLSWLNPAETDFGIGLSAYIRAIDAQKVNPSGRSGKDNENHITYGVTHNYDTVEWNKEFYNNLSDTQRGVYTIHEALHQMPGFSDQLLATAASHLAHDSQKPFEFNAAGTSRASRYLQEQIDNHCGPRASAQPGITVYP